jgi:hypothetical protein
VWDFLEVRGGGVGLLGPWPFLTGIGDGKRSTSEYNGSLRNNKLDQLTHVYDHMININAQHNVRTIIVTTKLSFVKF